MKTLINIMLSTFLMLFYQVCVSDERINYDELADLSWQVNKEYSAVENNCLIVAIEKWKRLEQRGKFRCLSVDKKYLPIERHCFLVVGEFILDNGFLKSSQMNMPQDLIRKGIL